MSFDRLAPFYRAMEVITAGGKLQRCRTAFIDEIPVPRRILLAGEGHGRSLPLFVEKFPNALITVIDSSEAMLKIARRKIASERVEFVHADFLNLIAPSGAFDLIVTNFFLDCFQEDELAVVVAKLGKMAAPQSDWLLADFEIAPDGAARLRGRIIVGMLYRFFQTVTGLRANSLVSPDGEIIKGGFTCHQRATYDWGLLKSEWWQRRP